MISNFIRGGNPQAANYFFLFIFFFFYKTLSWIMGTKYAPFNNISIKLRGSDLLTEEKHKLFHRKEHFSKVLFQSLQEKNIAV